MRNSCICACRASWLLCSFTLGHCSILARLPLDCVRVLSPSQLAIVTVAVLLATSLADEDMNQFLPFEKQLSAVESLVAHENEVPNSPPAAPRASSPSMPAVPFFDRVTPSLRANVCGLLVEMCWTHSETSVSLESNDWDVYYNNFEFVKWVMAQLVFLNSWFVATMAFEFDRETHIAPDLLALIPASDRAYTEASYRIFELPLRRGREVAIDGELASKDLLKMMVRWFVEWVPYESDELGDADWEKRQEVLFASIDRMELVELE